MATYHHSLSSIAISPQADAVGLVPGTPASFVATSGGSATSIVSTGIQGDADSEDDYVGWLAEAVGGTAANLGHFRKVITYADATGTLTTEAFPAASADTDRYRFWQTPHGQWAAETAAAASVSGIIHDAARDETVSFFVGAAEEAGPYMVVVDASALPSAAPAIITAYSNGFVKTADWGAAVAVGDLVQAVYFPEVMNDALIDLTEAPISREGPVGSYGKPAAARGNRSVAGTLELAFRGPGAARIGEHAEAHMLLRSVCDHQTPADATIDTGSTTSNITISSGTPVDGSMYALDVGDVLMCAEWSSPDVTPSPDVRTAPQGTQTLHGITTYTSSEGLNEALTIIQHRGDGVKEELYGCAPAISFSGARGEWLKITAAITGVDGYRAWKDHTGTAFARPWRPLLSTVAPVRLTDCRVVIGGTELDVASFSIDLGQTIVPKGGLQNANEAGGLDLVDDHPTGQMVALADSDILGELDAFTAGETQTMLIQAGAAVGFPGLFGFWAYKVRYTGGAPAAADGQLQVTLPWEVVLDITETTLPRWAIGIG